MSTYKQLFQESLAIVWRMKTLWILGFFAILFSGSVEGDLYFNFLTNSKNPIYDLVQISSTGVFNQDFLINFQNSFLKDVNSSSVMIFVFFGIVILLLLILVLSITSQLVIMKKTGDSLKLANIKNINIADLIINGVKEVKSGIFSAALLNIAFKIIVFIVFILITLPVMMSVDKPGLIYDLWYLLSFIILLPSTIIFSFFIRYATAGIAIHGLNLKEAISNSWRILKNNWLISVEVSFMVFLINIFSVFIILLILAAVIIPLWLIAMSVFEVFGPKLYVFSIGFSYLLLFFVYLTCSAILSTFNVVVWANMYQKLNKNNISGKIKNFFRVGTK